MSRCPYRLICILAAVCLGVANLYAAEVTGHIRVLGGKDRAAGSIIVFAISLDGVTPIHSRAYTMTQRHKAFTPRILAIPVGSSVEFPNKDIIFHNVFSLSRPDPFDLGLYRAGASKVHTFNQAGTYQVFCNIHPEMTAIILVLQTSFISKTDAADLYQLSLPPGRYRITAWSERAQPAAIELRISTNATAPELTLDESKFVALPHKNKYGQNYPDDYNTIRGERVKHQE